MAQHWTNAQIETCLALTVGNIKPYQLNALQDALSRVPYVEDPDGSNGSDESTLTSIFSNGLNP